ncbi:MAG: ParB/RepB/Spo0J family partition protein [Holosporaceae bacterium]|jgi:ParB family chromosome partitioning protein|nr:ParB/RepB/Spo0J family partition protein [Holosporaceae bacterium]
MTNKPLGRGLSAFLDMKNLDAADDAATVVKLSIGDIKKNPFQPRQAFEEEALISLSESIKKRGILQPILVIRLGNGGYQLVAGERRLRAAQLAGLAEVPAMVVDLKSQDQLEVAILENIQRENLNPLEEAEAYHRLMGEFHHTQEELAEMFSKSRSYIANTLRLLSLPEEVKAMVTSGKLSAGHARTLLGAADAVQMAQLVLDQSLSVRQTEEMIRNHRESAAVSPRQSSGPGPGSGSNSDSNSSSRSRSRSSYVDPEILNIAAQISSLVGLQAKIRLKGSGGTVEMDFKNFEELDFLLKRLNP